MVRRGSRSEVQGASRLGTDRRASQHDRLSTDALVSDAFRAGHPEVLERTTNIFLANDVECYAASCGLLGAADTRAPLRLFKMPTAIVVGEEDYATPVAMARQLHEAIPQSTLSIIAGARHLTPIEFPDRIAAELRGLLTRV
jgi:3-oxoadipate enol-lactonase